ncbi:MAG TPA: hypothetical protein VF914_19090 [Chloroflexia bacterium]|jgi:hypothetical protein
MKRSCIVAGAILILVTVSSFMLPEKAHANICVEYALPVEIARAKADSVFTGKVIAITEGRDNSAIFSGGLPFQDVTFEVMTAWKGVSQPEVTLRQIGVDSAFEFQLERSYLVYAAHSFASNCTRTSLLDVATADIRALGQGRVLKEASPASDPTNPALLFLALLVSAVLGAVILRHRSRSLPGR